MALTLSNALDLSSLKTSSSIRNRFSELAEYLLLHYKLCIEDASSNHFEFQLLEIEFYLHFPDLHEDPFCHNHVNQTRTGEWYFHRARTGEKESLGPAGSSGTKVPETKAGGYRGGTRKGVDIAFGNPITSSFFPSSSAIRGGILLRSMRSLSSESEIISGPSLLVDKILELTDSESIVQLVNHKLKGHLSVMDGTTVTPAATSDESRAKTKLYLRPIRENSSSHFLTTDVVECSPRVGLDLSHPSVSPVAKDPRVSYIGKMYRYFTHPHVLKAGCRYHNLVWYLSRQDFINRLGEDTAAKLAADLLTRFGKETYIRRMQLEKYIAAFKNGYQKQDLKLFVGTVGKGTSSNPIRFLTMIGVLCRLGILDEL